MHWCRREIAAQTTGVLLRAEGTSADTTATKLAARTNTRSNGCRQRIFDLVLQATTLPADRQLLPIAEELSFLGRLRTLMEQCKEGYSRPDIEAVPKGDTVELSILFCGTDAEGSESTCAKHFDIHRDCAQDIYSGHDKHIASPVSV